MCTCVWPSHRCWSQVWSTKYRYKTSQSQQLIRDHLEINHILQWEGKAHNTTTTWGHSQPSSNECILICQIIVHVLHVLGVKRIRHQIVFRWSCWNGNEASVCQHLIREEWKEVSGGGIEEKRRAERQEMVEETMATRMEDRENSKMI